MTVPPSMPQKDYSKEFARLYDKLPPNAQQALVTRQLIPLLKKTHHLRAERILSYTRRAKVKYAHLPQLDARLSQKKAEINGLIEELQRDQKIAYFTERSSRDELLHEVIQSVAEWLNDIWSLVYEYRTDFKGAHACLLFSLGVLDHLQTVRGLCKCVFSKIYIPITIKKRSGKVVRRFTATGIENTQTAVLWIFRELYLSLLATENEQLRKDVPNLLEDIDDIGGWEALEKVVCGGKTFYDMSDEEEETQWIDTFDDDEVDETEEDEELFEARHWTNRIRRHCLTFRNMVTAQLIQTFRASPSFMLYTTMINMNVEDPTIKPTLLSVVHSIARTSGQTAATAIQIYAMHNDLASLASLLDTHSHLLRPRDARQLQLAAKTFDNHPLYRQRSSRIAEKELRDTAACIGASIKDCFSQTDTPDQRAELLAIVKLRRGTTARAERIERWVDNATSPSLRSQAPEEIALAAMMAEMGVGLAGLGAAPGPVRVAAATMGIPIDPDDVDPMGMLDMHPDDEDLADVREDVRPDFKTRWTGWVETAQSVTGGTVAQIRVFKFLLETMPFLRVTDVVEEMMSRITEKQSKLHICNGMEVLTTFVKIQSKRCQVQRKEAERRAAEAAEMLSTSRLKVPSSFALDLPGELSGTPELSMPAVAIDDLD